MEKQKRIQGPADWKELFRESGRIGGNIIKAKYGKDWYSKISKKGWANGKNKKRAKRVVA
jgi:Fe-S cluster biosynthesis and repair protein YggX